MLEMKYTVNRLPIDDAMIKALKMSHKAMKNVIREIIKDSKPPFYLWPLFWLQLSITMQRIDVDHDAGMAVIHYKWPLVDDYMAKVVSDLMKLYAVDEGLHVDGGKISKKAS